MRKSCSALGGGGSFILSFPSSEQSIKYSSNSTRFATLHGLMGGAEIEEMNPLVAMMPHDDTEDLESRFNSGVNRTDVPRMWGHPNVARKLCNVNLGLSGELKSWRRDGGEPLYRKAY